MERKVLTPIRLNANDLRLPPLKAMFDHSSFSSITLLGLANFLEGLAIF